MWMNALLKKKLIIIFIRWAVLWKILKNILKKLKVYNQLPMIFNLKESITIVFIKIYLNFLIILIYRKYKKNIKYLKKIKIKIK